MCWGRSLKRHRLHGFGRGDGLTPDRSMEPLMNASDFRNELRRILRQNHSRVLLRIVSGPGFTNPLELTGSDILERAEALAELYTKAAPFQTVLLLLPHSPELF